MLQHKSILKGLLTMTKRLVISALIYQPPVLSRPPVPTDHEGLHGGQVEGAQVGREPRGPALQLPAGALVLPPPDIVELHKCYVVSFCQDLPPSSENLSDLVIPGDGLRAHHQHQHVVPSPPPPRVQDQTRLPLPLHLGLVELWRK